MFRREVVQKPPLALASFCCLPRGTGEIPRWMLAEGDGKEMVQVCSTEISTCII
jgi:hypothetical protein